MMKKITELLYKQYIRERSDDMKFLKDNNIEKCKIDLFIVVMYIILPILFFWRILGADTWMAAGDGFLNISSNSIIKEGIINGDIPLWNRFNASGTAFMADIQNKFFYPFTWLIMPLPIKLGFKMFFLLHLSLGAIFMYMYLKSIKISRLTAFLGGIIFMFSNLLIIRYEHINVMDSIIWTPMLLLLVEKLVVNKKSKYSVFLGLVMAIQFLGGFPQIAIYSDIFIFGYYLIASYNREKQIEKVVKNVIKQSIIFISTYIGVAAMQIIPLIELMRFSGRNIISYEYFASYSYNLRMLASMLFPSFWGSWASNLKAPMEFPTDIYVGIIPLCLIIYGVIVYNKEKRVRFLIFTMIITMLYACSPQVSLLGKIIYKIPILGSFRVQSRILFLFVIAAIILSMFTLEKIFEKNEFEKYFKFSVGIFIMSCIASIIMISFAKTPIINIEYKNYYESLGIYKNTIFMLILNMIMAYVMFKKKLLLRKRQFRGIIYFILCVLIVGDVYYINIDDASGRFRKSGIMKGLESNGNLESSATEFLHSQPDIDKYRYILDNYTNEEFISAPLGLNANNNIYNKLMSVQSYITFENKNYLSLTGAINGKFITTNGMNFDINPSVLSMLSDKYIIKHKGGGIPNFNTIIGEKSIYDSGEEIKVISTPQNVGVYPININIQKNKMLVIEGEMYIKDIPDKFITLDLYGNNGSYDLAECNEELLPKVSNGSNNFKFVISTGNVEIPKDAVFRICMYDSKKNNEIVVKNLKISEIQTETVQKLESVYEDKDITIYENNQAKPILYMPKEVINFDNNAEKIDTLRIDKDLVNTSYITGFKNMNLEEIKSTIDITGVKNNSVTANITVSEDAFINMSQCYYPGWNVYIDGKKSKLYEVNSVIQGSEIPKGTHMVKFEYQPNSMYVGIIISISTIIIILILFIKKNKIKQ